MTETEPDLVQRLREAVSEDHTRGCQGRQYSCSCGRDISLDVLLRAAATEIERLRGVAQAPADCAADLGKCLDLIDDWDRHGSIDHSIAYELHTKLKGVWTSLTHSSTEGK